MPEFLGSNVLGKGLRGLKRISAIQAASLSERAIALFIGHIVSLCLAVVVPVVLVRIFPREVYGLYQQLLLIFTTLLPFGQWGVTQGLSAR
ncbi:MAG: hypothetical protein ACOX5Z_09585 [Desulfobulbus sp.]